MLKHVLKKTKKTGILGSVCFCLVLLVLGSPEATRQSVQKCIMLTNDDEDGDDYG